VLLVRRLPALLSGCLLLSASLCWGNTIYIKPDGTGDAPTIAAGLAAAGVGDTLLLASGRFTGVGNRDITIPDKNLTIVSETGNPADCVIDFERNFGFYFAGGTAVIRGITLTDAIWSALRAWTYGHSGYVDLEVIDCVFSNCEGDGSGINISCYGEVRITGCRFLSNVGRQGGAISVGAQVYVWVWIDSCVFCSNSADCGAAVLCWAPIEMTASIANSVFCHNSAEQCGGAIASGELCPHIEGCTFFANSAPVGSAFAGVRGGCSNCIVAYGSGGAAFDVSDPSSDPWLSCTDIYGNEGGDWVGAIADQLGQNGNFSACPSFCNWDVAPYDLHLCSASPCLPGNHPDGSTCGLIGALGQGCACGPSGTEPSTWGAIKAMRR
jgi:predicted outer membrane repeat protein